MVEPPLTPTGYARLQELFEAALALPADVRESYLESQCGQDAHFRDEVLRLLAAHSRSDTAIGHSVRSAVSQAFDDDRRWIGVRLGPWQVTRQLGRGGMGTVCEAIRADDQYHKRVAVKFLHRYAGSPDTVRRFKAERQILANLDHANIATLIDGGVTDDSQPYIVMEYVDGVSLTQWVDERKLPPRDRINLFLQICAAVESAHRSLVVHRDLKPANMLVTAAGQVKLLDFGIARLLGADNASSDSTLTQVTQRSFTPEYASPEQVRGLPVGTPSDIYSLGVVLFELLCGRKPIVIQSQSLLDIERAVCETSVPRAGLNDDLDAIMQVSMHKDPERRYGSVGQFAADLHNYLAGRPVSARPDSAAYRLRKLVSRRRLETAAVVVATLSLLGGLIASVLQTRRAEAQSLRAEAQSQRAEQVTAFLTTMLGAANPGSLGKDVKVREVLDTAAKNADSLRQTPGLEVEVRNIIGGTYVALGEFAEGATQFRLVLDAQRKIFPSGDNAIARTLSKLSHAQEYLGEYDAAQATLVEAENVLQRFPNLTALDQSDHLDQRGRILARRGQIAEAETFFKQALALLLANKAGDAALSVAYANLGFVASELGRAPEALEHYTRSVTAARRAFARSDPQLSDKLSPYAAVLERSGQLEKAAAIYRETLELRRAVLGPEHPEFAWTAFSYADHLVRRGLHAEAGPLAREVVALRGRTLPDSSTALAAAMQVLGRALGGLGELPEAERWLRESLALRLQHLPAGHWLVPSSESTLGGHLVLAKRYSEAEPILLAAESKLVMLRGESAPVVADARQRIVDLYDAWRKPVEAAGWRAKLPSRASTN